MPPTHQRSAATAGRRGCREAGENGWTDQAERLTDFAARHASDLIERIGPDGRYLYVNDAWCARHRYTRDEALALHIWDVDGASSPEEWPAEWKRHQEQGVLETDAYHRAKDGEVFPVEILVYHVELEGEEHDISFLRDITQRRQAEETIRRSEEWYRTLVEEAGDGMILSDPAGRIVDVNRRACERLGYTRREMLAMYLADIDPNATHPDRRELRRRALTGAQFTFESFQRRKDGSLMPVEVTLGGLSLPSGRAVLGIVRDLTERRQAEEERRQLIDAMGDSAFVIDFTGRFIEVNRRALEVLGYSKDELLTMKANDIDAHLRADRIAALLKNNARGEPVLFETGLKAKDGTVTPVEISSKPISYRGRSVALAVARDISERKQAEKRLQNEILRRRVLVDGSSDGIVILDARGKVHEANQQFARMLGYSTREVHDLHAWDWDAAHDKNELQTILAALDEEGDHFETVYRRKDGSLIEVESSANAPIVGGEKYIFTVCRDVTQRNLMKRALITEKERLSLLNTAAVDISHCLTASEVLRTGVRLACETTGCDGGVIRVFSSAGRSRTVSGEGLTREERAQLTRLVSTSSAYDRLMSERTCIRLGESEVMPAHSSGEGVFAGALLVPVISRGEVLGVLCLATRQGRPYLTEEHIALAEAIAALIGVALKNAFLYDQARYLSQRDPVTGLLNHRGVSVQLQKELARSERSGSCLSVIMMDLDNFKLFNDTYGHACGDKVLKDVSAALSRSVRRVDTLGRYGGDEFVALLPDTDASGAVAAGQRIRAALRELDYGPDGGSVPVFMSFGVATYPVDGPRSGELLAVADTNLYRSKRQGGNCITSTNDQAEWSPTETGLFTVLDGLVNAVDGKDRYTRKHSDDVSELVVAVAAELGLSPETQRSLRIAALLHDVGKIGVPDHILRKPGRLTEEELTIVRQHVYIGEVITKEIPDLVGVMEAVSTHHERYDGRGYPNRLKSREIPLSGRILAAADAYSAMTTDRPYRKALSPEEARSELKRVSGTQLDPRVVRAFLAVLGRTGSSESSESGANAPETLTA